MYTSSSSSEEDGEIITNSVTNYHFLNHHNVPVTFTDLPLHLPSTIATNATSSSAFLIGSTDNGLQSVYVEVTGWRYDLSYSSPEVYVAKKTKKEKAKWIRLVKARNSFEAVVRSDLVVVKLLHYLKRCCEASRDEVVAFLTKSCASSNDVIESLESCLADYVPLIQSAMENDKDLAKSKYLNTFLMEIDNLGGRETFHEENQTTRKTKFIVSDEEEENDDVDDEEDEVLFDSVCAFCDNGGDVLPCEGQCIRSFHPTIDAGIDTRCESLGFENAAQYEAIPDFLCDNCKFQKHQCFACGMLGSSDKSSAAEVFPCVSATCGHFYHPDCVAKLLHPADETLAMQLGSEIAGGESFTCPAHKCHLCEQGEDKNDRDMQFAVCRRCPKSYHRKCLPKEIAFAASDDGAIVQRAWDDLLPKRIMIYCLKHTLIPRIATPGRDHLLFPCITWKRDQDGNKTEHMSERRSKTYGNFEVNETVQMPKVIEKPHCTVTYGDTIPKKEKYSHMNKKISSFEEENISNVRKPVQPSNKFRIKLPVKNMQRDQPLISKPVTTRVVPSPPRVVPSPPRVVPSPPRVVSSPPRVDADMKTRMLKLIKDSTSSFDFEEFIREKKKKCTHQTGTIQTGLDKSITMGKVEASVKAVRRALQIVENGGSVQDAKAVCEPNVLNQLNRWKGKLRVFLAPFLHGTRYTSFGRHFTKVDKLREIVDRLHWYVQDGDTIVDFCCGSNDFSVLMKEKLDITGKKCLFRNYDLITPKNPFEFEKRDWFSVPVDELPDGSRLVMGLNPPFGVNASLANKFIDHALKFNPKLLILIVPPETQRLDWNRSPYDLIWQETSMLSGKAFYLPGSVDIRDQPIEDYNHKPPPLSLWSRPDWTTKHEAIAEERGHVKQKRDLKRKRGHMKQKRGHMKQKRGHVKQKRQKVVSNYLMEEKHDCYDFSTYHPNIATFLDDVPEELEPDGRSNPFTGEHTNMTSSSSGTHISVSNDDVVDMDLSSPIVSSKHSEFDLRNVKPLCLRPSSGSGKHIPATNDDVADMDLSSQVVSSKYSEFDLRNVKPLCLRPSSGSGKHIPATNDDVADMDLSSQVVSSKSLKFDLRNVEPLCLRRSSGSGKHFPVPNDDVADLDLSSPVVSSKSSNFDLRNVKPLCVRKNPSLLSQQYAKPRTNIQETVADIADMDLSSPVLSSTNSRFEPSHYEHHLGFSQPQYMMDTYGADIGYGYDYLGQNHFPGDYGMDTSYTNYGHPTYPSAGPAESTIYSQPDFTDEPNLWPPGTAPPDHRYN